MPYALVGPGVSGVYFTWSEVEELASIFPYCRYRKFDTEEACWEFVYRYKSNKTSLSMTKYGDTFDNLFIRMSYALDETRMYFNYNTEKFGRVKIDQQENQLIQYTAKYILVTEPAPKKLDNKTIISHLETISRGVEIIGDLVDIDIVLPDHSIYYALTTYSGDNEYIATIKNKLHARTAEISFTLKGK